MEALDLQVARAVAAVALMERALHESSGWEMRWGPLTVSARREIFPDGIDIIGEFPEACYIVRPEPRLVLLHRGEVMGVRDIDYPGDCAFSARWAMRTQVVLTP